ncbi:unnamed protein product [Polarella glacialis]|uniref:Uncharacterized protein n=1 Tax=Polarella glacialis TaxID=89957 RepID=A0A813JB84_POLGL|nr:unnamed protein product [Polarella glacialis]
MTPAVLRFLEGSRIAHPFNASALLLALAAWSRRCDKLLPRQRDLLRVELARAMTAGGQLPPAIPSVDVIDNERKALAICQLPIWLSEDAARAARTAEAPVQTYRPLTTLAVVEGEPLNLLEPPPRLDLDTMFLFLGSDHMPAVVREALTIREVKECLTSLNRWMDEKSWLRKQVSCHMAELVPGDQVLLLERLLPLIQDLDEANSPPYLVPVESAGGRYPSKPPGLVLDPQDFTIQEVFGISGEDCPALGREQQFHFPAKSLSTSVRTHLRRLGMRASLGDGGCLAFLCEALRGRHAEITGERYGEVQRGLLQRMVESWNHLQAQEKVVLLSRSFVDLSVAADGGEQSDSVLALRPFRDHCEGRLFSLSELVSRADAVAPYLCWTSLPLCPRGFPDFPGYKRPALEDVLKHARVLGELADTTAVSFHQWEELKERVVAPICEFLAASELLSAPTSMLRT